jgi:hypothetical protein
MLIPGWHQLPVLQSSRTQGQVKTDTLYCTIPKWVARQPEQIPAVGCSCRYLQESNPSTSSSEYSLYFAASWDIIAPWLCTSSRSHSPRGSIEFLPASFSQCLFDKIPCMRGLNSHRVPPSDMTVECLSLTYRHLLVLPSFCTVYL